MLNLPALEVKTDSCEAVLFPNYLFQDREHIYKDFCYAATGGLFLSVKTRKKKKKDSKRNFAKR